MKHDSFIMPSILIEILVTRHEKSAIAKSEQDVFIILHIDIY